MYKAKLQELCHSKSWDLPKYIITKNGPDHCPNFGASVTVNDFLFQTQAPVKSSKMAQNDVAKIALDYFSTVPLQQTAPRPTIPTTLMAPSKPLTPQQPSLQQPPSKPLTPQQPSLQQQHQETSCFNLFPQPSMPTQACHQPLIISSLGSLENIDGVPMPDQIQTDKDQLTGLNATSSALKDSDANKEQKRIYKHRLQHYAQKKNLKLPWYSCEREGPSHANRFKCHVTIDGKTYTSDDSFFTIKDAENEVARIALASLSQFGAQEVIQNDNSCYKNLLQELTQKRKSNLPIYETKKIGECHVPEFISTVEFEGEIFTGEASKTKKQAEMSAAEVAYHSMRKQHANNLSLNNTNGPQQCVTFDAFINLNSCLATPKQESVHNLPLDMTNEPQQCATPNASINLSSKQESVHNLQVNLSNERRLHVTPNASINLNSCLATPKQGSDCGGDIQDALVSSSTVPLCHLSPASEGTPSKRICIYPRTADMSYPEGGIVLPMSDDKWVALSLGGNQHSANV